MSAPQVVLVNRKRDEARLARFAASAAAQSTEFIRIDALDGHDPAAPFFLYKHLLGESFWGEDRIKPGAFACFLSHAAAWRRFLAEDWEAALICEDDAVLLTPPDAIALPDEFDVLLAGERIAKWRAGGDAPAPLGDAIREMAAAGRRPGRDGLAAAPGAEAYVVSRAGAKKLLNLMTRDRIRAGVDWAILGWGLPEEARPDWPEFAHLPADALNVFIAAAPAARVERAPSAIDHSKTVPIGELRARAGFEPLSGSSFAALRQDPVAEAFSEGSFYEEPALELLTRWMPKGGVFVDIGAHIGNHTLFMLRHGGAARAIVFEFSSAAIAALHEAIAAFGLKERVDATHLGFGLAEDRGRRARRGAKPAPYICRLKHDFDEDTPVKPGAQFLKGERPDLIKIDVNGEEREVLKGLTGVLKQHAPLLALDLSHPRSPKAEPLLERLGYKLAERAAWREGDTDRVFAIYRPTRSPNVQKESDRELAMELPSA